MELVLFFLLSVAHTQRTFCIANQTPRMHREPALLPSGCYFWETLQDLKIRWGLEERWLLGRATTLCVLRKQWVLLLCWWWICIMEHRKRRRVLAPLLSSSGVPWAHLIHPSGFLWNSALKQSSLHRPLLSAPSGFFFWTDLCHLDLHHWLLLPLYLLPVTCNKHPSPVLIWCLHYHRGLTFPTSTAAKRWGWFRLSVCCSQGTGWPSVRHCQDPSTHLPSCHSLYPLHMSSWLQVQFLKCSREEAAEIMSSDSELLIINHDKWSLDLLPVWKGAHSAKLSLWWNVSISGQSRSAEWPAWGPWFLRSMWIQQAKESM